MANSKFRPNHVTLYDQLVKTHVAEDLEGECKLVFLPLSEKVLIQNQQFSEAAVFELKAKNKIVIGKNTIIKPTKNGSVVLKIDPILKKQCDLVLREGFPNNKYYHPNN